MKRKLRGKIFKFEWIKNEFYKIWSETYLSTKKGLVFIIKLDIV